MPRSSALRHAPFTPHRGWLTAAGAGTCIRAPPPRGLEDPRRGLWGLEADALGDAARLAGCRAVGDLAPARDQGMAMRGRAAILAVDSARRSCEDPASTPVALVALRPEIRV